MVNLLHQAKEINPPVLPTKTARQTNSISEQKGQYVKTAGERIIPLSNFIIVPEKRIWIDNKEAIQGKLVHQPSIC